MAFPEPQPGLVIRYAYLWRREQSEGKEEASKDRPCVIVFAVQQAGNRKRVFVVPITHAPPAKPTSAIEIPAATKLRLGLDDLPSWIVTSELNSFLWTGPDIRPTGKSSDEQRFAYGFLPFRLIEKIIAQVQENRRAGLLKAVSRTE